MSKISGNVLGVLIVVAFGFTVAGCVVIFIAVPEGGNPGSLVALLIGAFTALVPSLVGLVKLADVAERVGRTGKLVDHLANGGGDAKFTAAVHRAMDERERATSEPGTPPDDTETSSRA